MSEQSFENAPREREVRRLLKRMAKRPPIVVESAEGRSVPLASRAAAQAALLRRKNGAQR